MNIDSLPDEELRRQLQEYGVNVGPIVSSTRLLYEKKLAKLIESGGVLQQPQPEEYEDEEEEEEEEDEEVQINYSKPPAKPKPAPVETKPKQIPKPQYTSTPVTQTDYVPVTQARVATPTQAVRRNVGPSCTADTRPTTSDGEQSSGGGGISMWIKVIFVIVLAFLVYLVIINMNPSAQDKIPVSYEEDLV
ncbi:hypothetical protein ACF0H5_003314 [Mactra antiquata]